MAGTSVVVDLLLKAKDLASAPIRGIVASIKFLDSGISVVAGKIRSAFSGLFGGGLDGAIEFEAQLSKVAAKGGFTAAEMETLKKAATDIGAKFGTTGTEAAQGMEALAASGLNATQVMQALPPVLALAKAEGLGMDAAAEKLSDSLATMGLGFDQAARLANVLAKGANVSTTSASALAEALAAGGGIARDFGLSMEQTIGALAAFANNGIKGSAAGTALQAILGQLINPASQASKALSDLGIESRDFGEVIGALKDKGAASNAAILAFGETAGPGLRALIKTGQQGLSDLTGQLQSADGAAEAAATGINSNLKGALSALTAAWANVKTALFEPVLEPLTKQARALADTLNTNLSSGALKPVQEAIRSFATNGAQAARDFIASFDFNAALQSLQGFATAAKDSFSGIKDAGVTTASVVQIAWNGLTAGLKTIGASLLAVAASAVSNIAAIEAAASKVGLGSLQRAAELQATANELAAKAGELTQSIAKDGEDIRAAFDRLADSTGGAADGIQRIADAQQGIKDSSPVAEIQEITLSLGDYQEMAERANASVAKARSEYEAGKISAADYGQALLVASEANANLADATERQTASEQRASAPRRKSALELESIAKAAEETANRQGDYVSALERAGDAQADAIRSEIELARAKGDGATVATKTIELARVEADTASKVATAKQQEADEMAKVVVAKQAYLASINGGTAAQQQELQTLKLKLKALQSEAEQAKTTAQAKEIAAKNAAIQSIQTDKATESVERNTVAAENNAKANEDAAKSYTLMEDAATGAVRELSQLSAGTNALISEMLGLRDAGKLFGAEWTGELGKLKLALNQTEDAIKHNLSIIGPYAGQFEKSANAVNTVRKAYLEQAIAAESLGAELTALNDDATANERSLSDLASAAENAKKGFGLLDDARLDKLQAAIDAANDKLRKMREETQAARDDIASLNAEIAAEKGDKDKADLLQLELDRKRAIADADAKLAEAQAANNAELIALYEEQKRKLEELYNLKQKNLDNDIKQRKNETNNSKTTTTSTTTGQSPSAPSSPAASGGGGITVNVNANNARLLDNKFVEDLGRQLAPVFGNIGRRLS